MLKNKFNFNSINIFIMYFIILTSTLFYGSDYYPYITKILLLIYIYALYFSYKNNWSNIKKFIKSKFFIWYIVFFVFAIIITFFRNNIQLVEFIKSIIILSLTVFLFVILDVGEKCKNNFNIIDISQATTVLVAIWIILFEYNTILNGERIGYSINIGNPNSIGFILGLFSIFNFYSLVKNRKIKDIIIYLINVLFVVLTGSKKALVILLFGFLILLFKNNKISKKRAVLTVSSISIFLVLCFVIPILYKYIGVRFLELLGGLGVINYETDSSTILRITYALSALNLWYASPLFGGGFDNFRINSGYQTYSHNNFTELLSAFGIIGFILYYSFFIYFIYKMYCNKNEFSKVYMVILIAMVFTDFASVTFLLYPLNYIFIYLTSTYIGKDD